jgi:hypothetical protein
MQRNGAIFLRGTFEGKLTRVIRDMWRANRTASSNPPPSASKSLSFAKIPERTEESCEMARNVRALARGSSRTAKERRREEPHSAPFRGIFSGTRWQSPDSL